MPRPGRRGRVFFDREPAGWLEEEERGGAVTFRYDPGWLARADAHPVSLTLPLRREPYRWRSVHPFFLNLLPEGWLLELALSRLKLSRDDPFGLVLALCRDCQGAVRVLPEAGTEPGDDA